MTLDAIRSVPLFAPLHDDAAAELRDLLSTRDVISGDVLFRAGDEGDALYLIESGRIRISVKDEDERQIVLAELARGDFFGEMAIIDGKQRSADADVIEEGRLAVLSRERSIVLPDLATAAEQGLADFDVSNWFALALPRATPEAIVRKLNAATRAALDTREVQEQMRRIGGNLVAPERRSPEYLQTLIASEIARWGAVVKQNALALD